MEDTRKSMNSNVLKAEPETSSPKNMDAEAERRQQERLQRQKIRKETKETVAALKSMLDDREKRVEQWACNKIRAKREEIDMLEIQGLPARNYLFEHVLPCITDALLEVVKVRPSDPIDFLVI
jgi:Dpy-30 motif